MKFIEIEKSKPDILTDVLLDCGWDEENYCEAYHVGSNCGSIKRFLRSKGNYRNSMISAMTSAYKAMASVAAKPIRPNALTSGFTVGLRPTVSIMAIQILDTPFAAAIMDRAQKEAAMNFAASAIYFAYSASIFFLPS